MKNESGFPETLYVIYDQRLSGTYLIARPLMDAFEPTDEIAVYELKLIKAPVKRKEATC